MKHFLGNILLLIGITLLVGYYKLVWWSFAPLAVLTGIIFAGHSFSKFMVGFLGVGGTWAVVSYYIYSHELGQLVPKVAQLFNPLTSGNPFLLMVITGFVGGIIGGISVLTGHTLRQMLYRKRKDDTVLKRR